MIVDDDVIAAARELQRLRLQQARLKKEEEHLRTFILGTLADETRALTASGLPVAHVEVSNRRGVNRDRLEALYPEVFEDVIQETEVRFLKTDLKDEL